MVATGSVGLSQAYITHPDYFMVQCWVHATYFVPDTITQMRPDVNHYYSSFWGEGYMPQQPI